MRESWIAYCFLVTRPLQVGDLAPMPFKRWLRCLVALLAVCLAVWGGQEPLPQGVADGQRQDAPGSVVEKASRHTSGWLDSQGIPNSLRPFGQVLLIANTQQRDRTPREPSPVGPVASLLSTDDSLPRWRCTLLGLAGVLPCSLAEWDSARQTRGPPAA
jgi:hypothetical protein